MGIYLENGAFEYHNFEESNLIKEPRAPKHKIRHSHHRYEIVEVFDGEANFTVNGRTFHGTPGDVVLIRRNDFHTITPYGDRYWRRVIEFEPSFLRTAPAVTDRLMQLFDQSPDFNSFAPCEAVQNSLIAGLFDAIENAITRNESNVETSMIVYLTCLLVELGRVLHAHSDNLPTANPIVESTINYIDEHIGERIMLRDIQNALGFSGFHLSHTFPKFMGITISEYIIEKKMLYAEKLIEHGKTPTEAAAAVCYNYSNFYTNYKRILHKTPKESAPNYARPDPSPRP